MTDQELEEARDAAEQICNSMNEVLDGYQIGHIIPAVIYILASMHDSNVMPKETFISEVIKGLSSHIDSFEEDKRGELQWLQ